MMTIKPVKPQAKGNREIMIQVDLKRLTREHKKMGYGWELLPSSKIAMETSFCSNKGNASANAGF